MLDLNEYLEEVYENERKINSGLARAKARFAMESAARIDGFSEEKCIDDFGSEDYESLIASSEIRGRGAQRRKSLADDMDLTEEL